MREEDNSMISPVSFSSPVFYYSARMRTGMPVAAGVRAGQMQPEDMAERLTPGNNRKVNGQDAYGAEECQTCKSRKYKDGSNDPGVSFKTATHLDPQTASYAIRAHEGEHVSHAWAEAAREDKEIISQSVSYHTDICPECGRVYMSGGNTRTVFRSAPETYEAEKVQKGRFIDLKV